MFNNLLWPLLVYGVAAILFVGGMLLLSYFISERHEELATIELQVWHSLSNAGQF